MKRHTLGVIALVWLVVFAFTIAPSYATGIGGKVYWYDQYGNLRALSWAEITVRSEDGYSSVVSYTTDGTYMVWVAPGTYEISVSAGPGFIAQSQTVIVPDGGLVAVDFHLQPSGQPVPEYPALVQPVLLLAGLLAVMVLTKRRHPVKQPRSD